MIASSQHPLAGIRYRVEGAAVLVRPNIHPALPQRIRRQGQRPIQSPYLVRVSHLLNHLRCRSCVAADSLKPLVLSLNIKYRPHSKERDAAPSLRSAPFTLPKENPLPRSLYVLLHPGLASLASPTRCPLFLAARVRYSVPPREHAPGAFER